jgi:CcmD family protein
VSGVDRLWFLFAAYSAFWLLLAFFLTRLGRRNRALERELHDLEARLRARPSPE